MKYRLLNLFLGLILAGALAVNGQTSATPVNPAAEAAVKDWFAKVNDQVSSGKTDEAQYTDLLHQADDIYAKFKSKQMMVLKLQLYVEVLTNDDRFDKAIACAEVLKKDFPDPSIDRMITGLKENAQRDKVFSALKPGVAMPDFAEKDANGQPLSLAAHKGKVLLVDFWATWCPPCMAEFPNVKKVYDTYHDKGLDIVGIDLDVDRDKFDSFLKEKGVTWPQYFDGLQWSNKLVLQYGVGGIPATFLLDKNGIIIAKSVRGEALSDAVASALSAK